MPPFPWDSLKAETLRTICKELGHGASSTTKRKRDDMVLFLKDVETLGLSSALQGSDATHAVGLKAATPTGNTGPVPVENLPHQDQPEDSDEASDWDSDVSTDDLECTGGCKDGWLSSRTKFVLKTVAAVASDLVLDTGEFAAEVGEIGGVYWAQHFPDHQLSQDKNSVPLWVEGYSVILGVIHEMFEAGEIPCTPALTKALGKLPKIKLKPVRAYEKSSSIDCAIYVFVQGVVEEWEGDFEDAHCDTDSGWDALPVCAKHDFDWFLVEDMLGG